MKLAFLFPLIVPLGFLPQLAATSQFATTDRPSFDDVYVNPQIERLRNCQSANLDVYFQQGAVTQHSAEYITDAAQAAGKCDVINVKILPIEGKGFSQEDREESKLNTQELGAWLNDLGVKYEVGTPQIQSTRNNLTYNGRTAQIVFNVKPASQS